MNIKDIDSHIIIALSQGSKAAFSFIYNAYAALVYKRLFYILKNEFDAEEHLQAVFVKLWMNREKIQLDKNILNYLMRIAHSSAIDSIRKDIRTRVVFDKVLTQGEDRVESVENKYLRKEDYAILYDAIEQLPTQRKLIFHMCKIEGKSYQEVSQELNISTSTISNQLVLAMKTVKAHVLQHHGELKIALIYLFLKNF